MSSAFGEEQHTAAHCPASPEDLLRLRLAVEASGEVIFMTDTSGTITYVNPEFVRLYGYAPSEVVGRSTPRLLKSGSTPAEEYASFWGQLRNNHVVRGEFINRTKSGSLIHVESSANPIVSNDELVGFLAIQRDITDRKATEAALRESERRYRTLAEAAHDSIFIVNRDGEIEYANTVSVGRFGRRTEDAIGKRLRDVFPPDTAKQMWRELSAVFTTGTKQYFESRFDTPNGELWLGSWIVPMSEGTTEQQAVMGVARDITDQKRLEKQFLQAQKMEAIGHLTGGIAHDFNNLLTAILGYSELLLVRVGHDSDLAADVEEIKKAGERASRLTRQLLAFSRKQVMAQRVLDLNDVVADLHTMLRRVINEDIGFEIRAQPDLDRVKADPSQIEQLLVNLAVNARDAMPRGGTLRIVTANVVLDSQFARQHQGAVPGRYVSLVVQDTGCGMTDEVLAHVFEPFFTTKPVGKGSGLGLASVYGIVKQNGGYIAITSAPGKGTTVTTYLPVVDEVAEPSAQPMRTKTPSGTETILLVEDDAAIRQLMQRTLQQCGYAVLNAEDVANALQIAERRSASIDLLLTDVIMPGLNGPDLAQRIVRLHPAIKVLYVSGFADGAVGASLSRKATFLPKPFTPRDLATNVREALDSHE
jgi:two-component system cell cycle sensor histidine kinase/response regulator CckA